MRSPLFPDVSLESKEIEPGLAALNVPVPRRFGFPLA